MTARKGAAALWLVFFSALAFFLYGRSLNGAFLWDDIYLIQNNVFLRELRFWPRFFTSAIGEGAGAEGGNFFRPLQMLSYALNYSFSGTSTTSYHAVNALLHGLVSYAVFVLVAARAKDSLTAFLAAFFFVIHPVHTETVCYISSRADLLAAFFILTAFLSYERFEETRSAATGVAALAAYAAALLAKEIALCFLGLVALHHLSARTRPDRKMVAALATITLFYAALRLFLLKQMTGEPLGTDTFFDRLPGFFVALFRYARLWVLPVGLHMEYGGNLFRWSHPEVWLGAGVAAFFLVLFRKFGAHREFLFWAGWYWLFLLPVSNLYRVNAFMAEHWLYLPSIPIFVAAAWFLAGCLRRRNGRRFAALGLGIGTSFYFIALTVWQNGTWVDPTAFFERTLRFTQSARVYYHLANLYDSRGDWKSAIASYEKSLAMLPTAEKFNNLGNLHKKHGDVANAVRCYEKALAMRPRFPQAFNNLANAYLRLGKAGEAVESYKKSIELEPGHADTHFNLGNAYLRLGRLNEAIACYLKVVAMRPQDAESHYLLGVCFREAGRDDLATRHRQKAIELGYVKVLPSGNNEAILPP